MANFDCLFKVGAGIQVPPNATRVLEWYGLMPQAKESGICIEAIDLRRYKDGKLLCSRPVVGEKSGLLSGSWLYV